MSDDLDIILNDVQTLDVDLSEGESLSFTLGQTFVSKDHTVLINRDAADQHPISAITGLTTALQTLSEGLAAIVPIDDETIDEICV